MDNIKDNLDTLMKQAQSMQEKLQSVQNKLAEMEFTGEAGAGLVKVTATGRHHIKNVKIAASLFEEDKEMVEDLVAAAINNALNKIETSTKEEVGKVASNMQLPENFKLPDDE